MSNDTVAFNEALMLARAHEQLWPGHNIYLLRALSRREMSVLCDGPSCDWWLPINALMRVKRGGEWL